MRKYNEPCMELIVVNAENILNTSPEKPGIDLPDDEI
jgi:hypothetical protein